MQVKIGTPLTEYAVAAGDIVLTSSRQVLIATANVNDYHYVQRAVCAQPQDLGVLPH